MRSRSRPIRLAGLAVVAIIAVSCGASADDGVGPGSADPTSTATSENDGTGASTSTGTPPSDSIAAPDSTAPLGGRALAGELAEQSDFAANLLPDLVVDDVGRGSEINIRNVFPADRPVLFWMWAPH